MEISVKISGLETLAEAIVLLASAIGHHNGMTNTVKVLDELREGIKAEKIEDKKENVEDKKEIIEDKKEIVEDKKEIVEEVSTPAQETVPTEIPAYTFEQIQVACANLAREGKRAELGNLIGEFGLASLPDLKEDQYNAFALKLREIGGTI